MALPKRKVFLMIGSSNMEGRIAYLQDVPQEDFSRWAGGTVPTQPTFTATFDSGTGVVTATAHGLLNGSRFFIKSSGGLTSGGAPGGLAIKTNYYARDVTANTFKFSLTVGGAAATFSDNGIDPHIIQAEMQSYRRPYHITVPGIRLYTIRLPYSLNARRLVVSTAGSNPVVVTYSGTDLDTKVDSWVYVPQTVQGNAAFPTAQGQLRRVTAQGSNTVTLATPDMSPALVSGDTIALLQDSHTISSATNVFVNGAPYTKITKTANSEAFTANDVGRFMLFPDALDGPEVGSDTGPFTAFYSAKVMVFDSATEVTLDRAVPIGSVAAAGKMVVVLAGANQVTTLETMEPPNAVLQDLTFFIDEKAPCYLTGLDYCNYNNWPYDAPKVFGGTRPLDLPQINSIPELTWRLRQKFDEPIVAVELGIGGAMVSPLFHYAPTFGPQVVPSVFGQLFSWLHEAHGFDFHPGSDESLFQAVVNQIQGTTTLLAAEGYEPDWDCCFINLADNDQSHEERLNKIGDNHRIVRDALREVTGNPKMRFIMAGPSAYGANTSYGGDVRDNIYAQLKQVADEDRYTAYIDTRVGYAKSPLDNLHYAAAGQIQLGKDFFAAYDRLFTDTEEVLDEVDVCNMALAHIGNKARVTSVFPSDGSPEADYCATYLPRSIKAILRLHAWGFATEKNALVVVNAPVNGVHTNNDNPAYLFRYEVPAKSVREIAIIPADAPSDELVGGVKMPIDFKKLRSRTDNKVRIYTNERDAHLRYVIHQTDLSQWDELAIHALSWHLASLLAGALIKSESGAANAENCLRWMTRYLAEAKEQDSNERQVTLDRPAAQIQARR